MRTVDGPEVLRQQVLDRPPEQVLGRDAEDLPGVLVGEDDLSGTRDDQGGVRRRVQQRPREVVAVLLEQR